MKIAGKKTSASLLIFSIWSVLAGIGGLVHGIGEVLQGNIAPKGIIIDSWTQGPIATNMGGEPGMTIIPNLLITGILTILISLAIIVWAVAFANRQHSGKVLFFLSVGMLLVGGGFGPPFIGFITSWAGAGINTPLIGWRKRLSGGLGRVFAALWPWVFAICLIVSFTLVVGSLILVYFFNVNNPNLFVNLFFFTLLSLPLTIITGFAYDIQHGKPEVSD